MSDRPKSAPHIRLARVRELAGYETASEAARAFGWNENTYRSHENGERGIRTDIATKYAKALRTTPDYILFGNHEDFSRFPTIFNMALFKHISGYVDSDGIITEYSAVGTEKFDGSYLHTEFWAPKTPWFLEVKSKSPVFGCFPGDLLVVSMDQSNPNEASGKLAIIETENRETYFRRIKSTNEPGMVDLALHPEISSDIQRATAVNLVVAIVQSGFWKRISIQEHEEIRKVIVKSPQDPSSKAEQDALRKQIVNILAPRP